MNKAFRFGFIGLGPTTIAMCYQLVQKGRVDPGDIVVVDPGEPMGHLDHCVQSIRMRQMRSGWGINVAGHSQALEWFSSSVGVGKSSRTPSWTILRDHSRAVWNKLGIQHIRAQVPRIASDGKLWQTWQRQSSDAYETVVSFKNLVIATGPGEHRRKPFANTIAVPVMPGQGVLAVHELKSVAFIGAGLTSAHLVQHFLAQDVHVTLFAPRGIVYSERDAKADWFNKECTGDCHSSCINATEMRNQLRRLNPRGRFELIKKDAAPGTVNDEHYRTLTNMVSRGRIKLVKNPVETVEDNRMVITKSGDAFGPFDQVYDARGFNPHVDNLKIIDGLRQAIGDRHYEGLPILDDRTGEVQPGLILTGPMAPMMLGPISHTIAGAVAHGEVLAENHRYLS